MLLKVKKYLKIDIFSDLRKVSERHQSLEPPDVQMIWACLNYEVLRETLTQKSVIKLIDYLNYMNLFQLINKTLFTAICYTVQEKLITSIVLNVLQLLLLLKSF